MKKIIIDIKSGNSINTNWKKFKDHVDTLEGKYEFTITKVKNQRTLRQNNALHLYFKFLADALNDAGWDMKKTLKSSWDIPWTTTSVKDHLWRPLQVAYLKKDSTTKLTTIDIDKIYDILNKGLGEKTGVHIDFPSIEALISREEENI